MAKRVSKTHEEMLQALREMGGKPNAPRTRSGKPITEEEMEKARKDPIKASEPRTRERIYVTLDPDARRIARKIGNGVVSRGIDRALFHFDECELRASERKPPKRVTRSTP